MTSSDSKHNLKESTSAMASSGGGGNMSSGGNAALTSVVTGGGSGSSGAIGSQPLSAANHLEIPSNNPNLLSPDILNQRRGTSIDFIFLRGWQPEENGENIQLQYMHAFFSLCVCSSLGSRRPSILPVPDMFTSSSFSISGNDEGEEGDESDDELDDDVPWRSPSEKIAYVYFSRRGFFV